MEIVNRTDLEWTETDREGAGWRRKQLGAAVGGDRLGTSLYVLPPGKRSWPYHYHTGNEEAIYVLEGSGQLRHGDDRHRLGPGDYVALPEGPEGGHRIINDSDRPLEYLAVSTLREPDVMVYPDSGKIGAFAGAPPGGDGSDRTVEGFFRRSDAVGYWEGEDR